MRSHVVPAFATRRYSPQGGSEYTLARILHKVTSTVSVLSACSSMSLPSNKTIQICMVCGTWKGAAGQFIAELEPAQIIIWSTQRYDDDWIPDRVGLWWHAALRNIQSEHQGQVNEMHTNFTAHKPWPSRVRYHDGVTNAQYVCFSLLLLSQYVCVSCI